MNIVQGSKKPKIVVVTGGVISSVGKGVAAAVIGAILRDYGYTTRIKKFDPYLNVDPGMLSPAQHGEVYVTDDGTETDLDAGHYERIGGVRVTSADYTAMGSVMNKIIHKERNGGFSGRTVQVVPHVTDHIKSRFLENVSEDVVICEIGGTVGDIEILPFLEAARQISRACDTLFVHISYLVQPSWISEAKTKPTQHSVSKLREYGINPHILGCRTEHDIPRSMIDKLSDTCGIPSDMVVMMPNSKCLYSLTKRYAESGLGNALKVLLKKLGATASGTKQVSEVPHNLEILPLARHKIALVTKYTSDDAHQSLQEALLHASVRYGYMPNLILVDAESLENQDTAAWKTLRACAGVIVPGGFGTRGIPGKLLAIKYARENCIPYLGICLGMQLSIIELLRANGIDADSLEFNPSTAEPAICLVDSWTEDGVVKVGVAQQTGGTLRLGAHQCVVDQTQQTISHKCYPPTVSPRHRHRYEVNPDYTSKLQKAGILIAGRSPEGLIEIVELANHPWFVGVQYHPEFTSRISSPEPLILGFVGKCYGATTNT